MYRFYIVSALIRSIFSLGMIMLLSYISEGQVSRIDSLKKEIVRPDNPDRLNSLLRLCNERNSLNPDTLLKYATAAKALAVSQGDPVKIALSEFYLTSHLLTRGLWDSSLVVADRQLKMLKYDGATREPYVYFSLLKARALNNSSRVKESLDLLYPLLNEAEKEEDTLTQISTLNVAVGSYVTVGQDRKALELGYRALDLAPKVLSQDMAQQHAITMNNLSLGYLHLNEGKATPAYLDSADYFVTRAIAIIRRYAFIDGLAYSLGLKGTILGYAGKINEGELALQESLQTYQKIGNLFYIINAMSVMGSFYITTHQPEKGIAVSLEGIRLAKNSKVNLYLYENLAENYRLKGEYKQYSETLRDLVVLKDSMYKVNSAEALSTLQTKYEVQAKENTIIRQKLDLTRKNNLIYGVLALLLVLLISGSILLVARRRNQAIKMRQLRAEEQRKTLQAVMEAEGNERKRIAAELHDGVAQKMVVAKMNLQTFESYFPAFNGEQQRVFDNISLLVDESCTEVRDLSHIMMPQAFFKSGLTEAAKNLLNTIPNKTLLTRFSAEGSLEGMDDNTQIMLYRILQECVQNVLKHAKASKLDIAIMAEVGEIDITIEDDGVGFDMAALQHAEGVGFQSIRSRVAYLNGRLEISSRPGAGTMIAIYIPKKGSV